MADAPQQPVLPDTLYVQKGFTGSIEELFTNTTPERALQRTLGGGRKAGDLVGVYKLERVVSIKVGVVEMQQQATPTDPPVAQNT